MHRLLPPPASAAPVRLQQDGTIAWVELLDTLLDLVERGALPMRRERDGAWPQLLRALATHIAAEAVEVVDIAAGSTPAEGRHTLRVSPPDRHHAAPALEARSRCATGFSAPQVDDFLAFCDHLHAACERRAAIDGERCALQNAQAGWAALPAGATARGGPGDTPPPPLAEALRDRHALTDREIAVAWHLACGRSIKLQSRAGGRSVETLRSQRRSVCRKLGVTGQHQVGERLFDLWHRVQWQAFGVQACRHATQAPTVQGPRR